MKFAVMTSMDKHNNPYYFVLWFDFYSFLKLLKYSLFSYITAKQTLFIIKVHLNPISLNLKLARELQRLNINFDLAFGFQLQPSDGTLSSASQSDFNFNLTQPRSRL